jgi:hypothetical protein
MLDTGINLSYFNLVNILSSSSSSKFYAQLKLASKRLFPLSRGRPAHKTVLIITTSSGDINMLLKEFIPAAELFPAYLALPLLRKQRR